MYDADELRDVADRSQRGAGTARATAAETIDPEMSGMLLVLADRLAGAAEVASQLAARIDPEGETTDG